MSVFAVKFRFKILTAGLLAITAAAGLAACGSSSTSSSATSSGTAAAATRATNASAVAVKLAHDSLGTYLVGTSGNAVYLWDGDQKDKSNCSGECATDWPPLTTTAAEPLGGAGVKAAGLGTVERAGGVKQVTYEGHPLYYFAGDGEPGAIDGQGSDGFGAKWWLLTPSGTAITRSSNASAQTSSAASVSSRSSNSTGGGW